MLESIALKFTERTEPLVVPVQGVTILVGPNNSGKSLVLREIEAAISTNGPFDGKVVKDFSIAWPTAAQFAEDVDRLKKRAPLGTPIDNIYVGRFNPAGNIEANTINLASLNQQFINKNRHWVSSQFWRFFQIRLDGRTRFDLTNDRPTGDLLQRPTNLLAHLFPR
jgi:hypothetical protein